MSIVKVPLLLADAVGVHITCAPPQPRVSTDERPKDVGAVERLVSSIARAFSRGSELALCSCALLEVAVIVASWFPHHALSQTILRHLVRGPTLLASRVGLSPAFVAGSVLVVAGGFVRYQCYRTLERFFTYELAIRDSHRLITSGPYAYVRHPGYTGGLAVALGMPFCWVSRGSWLRECGILETAPGKAALGLYAISFVLVLVGLANRIREEEALLRKQFGRQWDQWATRVPYKLIPCVW